MSSRSPTPLVPQAFHLISSRDGLSVAQFRRHWRKCKGRQHYVPQMYMYWDGHIRDLMAIDVD